MDVLADHYLGVSCPVCGDVDDAAIRPDPCPNCGGVMEPQLDTAEITVSPDRISDRPFDSMWRYGEFFPLDPVSAVTLDEGCTPMVACPTIADELGVGMVYVKLEGHNPTGTFKDRGQSLAMTAARAAGATDVALASAGNAGHAAAAYAAKAGLDAHVFLPSRAGFTQKAMVNVHGADLTVVEGRLDDAGAAYREALVNNPEWFPIATGDTVFRREGKKTMMFEIAEQLGWSVPEAIVYPTGGGVGLAGMYKGLEELTRLGWVDREPRFYIAQSTGCAPLVEAYEAGADDIEPETAPDTICGGIEVTSPGAARHLLRIVRETDGGAVATDDDAILDAAIELAQTEGLGIAPTAAATLSGARELATAGELGEGDTVVLVATGTALKEADVLRSQLMSHGV